MAATGSRKRSRAKAMADWLCVILGVLILAAAVKGLGSKIEL